MKLTQKNLDLLYVRYNGALNRGLQAAPKADPLAGAVMDLGTARSKATLFDLLQYLPQFKKMEGEREFRKYSATAMGFSKCRYDDGVVIPYDDILCDTHGRFDGMAEAMGAAWPMFVRQVRLQMLMDNDPNGGGGLYNPYTTISGLPFFAEDQEIMEAMISNCADMPLTADNYDLVCQMTAGWDLMGDAKPRANGKTNILNSKLLCPTFTHLLHSKELAPIVYEIFGCPTLDNEKPNRLYNQVIPVEVPEWVGTEFSETWILLDLSKPIKPFAQEGMEEFAVLRGDEGPRDVRKKGRLEICADGAFGVAPTLPTLAFAGKHPHCAVTGDGEKRVAAVVQKQVAAAKKKATASRAAAKKKAAAKASK